MIGFQEYKKTYISVGIIGIISYIILMVLFYWSEIFTFDHYYYYSAVQGYFADGTPYNESGFIYLDYFCILFSWLMLPFWLGLIIHVLINCGVVVFFIKEADEYGCNLKYWVYCNIVLLYSDIIQLNVNSLIPLAFYLYYKHRTDHPLAGFVLLLAFYKLTTILLFGVMALILLTDRNQYLHGPYYHKLDWFSQSYRAYIQLPALFMVCLIVWYSYLGSHGFVENVSYRTGFYEATDFITLLQPQHYFMYSFLLFVVCERWQHMNWKLKRVLWSIYTVLMMVHYLDHQFYYLFKLTGIDIRLGYIGWLHSVCRLLVGVLL